MPEIALSSATNFNSGQGCTLTFAAAIDESVNTAAVLAPANYSIIGGLAGLPVQSVIINSTTSITLITGPQQNGTTYTALIRRLDLAIPTMSAFSANFTGIGVLPQVSSARIINPARVLITFNTSGMLNLGVAANYTCSGGLTVSTATAFGTNSAYLTLSAAMANATTYTFTVLASGGSAITDAVGNTVDPSHHTATASAIHATPVVADHQAVAKSQMPSGFLRDPNFVALIGCFTDSSNQLEQAMADVQAFKNLASAYGATLDNLAADMNAPPRLYFGGAYLSDTLYRVFLQAWSKVINSNGTPEDLIGILRTLVNDPNTGGNDSNMTGYAALMNFSEGSTAECVLQASLPLTNYGVLYAEAWAAYLRAARPAGVRSILEYAWPDVATAGSQLFGWAGDYLFTMPTTPSASSGLTYIITISSVAYTTTTTASMTQSALALAVAATINGADGIAAVALPAGGPYTSVLCTGDPITGVALSGTGQVATHLIVANGPTSSTFDNDANTTTWASEGLRVVLPSSPGAGTYSIALTSSNLPAGVSYPSITTTQAGAISRNALALILGAAAAAAALYTDPRTGVVSSYLTVNYEGTAGSYTALDLSYSGGISASIASPGGSPMTLDSGSNSPATGGLWSSASTGRL